MGNGKRKAEREGGETGEEKRDWGEEEDWGREDGRGSSLIP